MIGHPKPTKSQCPGRTFSLVLPVFNAGSTILECVTSVADAVAALPHDQQQRMEVVICDNHSTDETVVLATSVEQACEVRVVRPPQHEVNRTRNWSHGLTAAHGTWLMMLHGDDMVAPDGLVSVFGALDGPDLGGVVLIQGQHRTFEHRDDMSRLRPTFPSRTRLSGTGLRRYVLPIQCPFVPFGVIRRSALDAVGGLDDQWELVQDWDLWQRVCAEGDVLYVPGEVGWWRQHPTSDSYKALNARELQQLATERGAPMAAPGVAALARLVGRCRARHITESLLPMRPSSTRARAAAFVARSAPRIAAFLLAALRLAGWVDLRRGRRAA